MVHRLEEVILAYQPAELARWKQGHRDLIPAGTESRDIVANQPSYHFGEHYVLAHFMREGWSGYPDYLLMPEVEPRIARHQSGRKMLERIALPERLLALRLARRQSEDGRKGYGEPDLFLYKSSGEMLFLEVKKQGDTVMDRQLICLAQIRQYLKAEAQLVYLQEAGKRPRTPKVFEVDLASSMVRRL